MNNTPDYDNLAFKPELTWEELCEWAKDKGAYVLEQDEFYFDYLWFSSDGDITLKDGDTTYFVGSPRTYEQMKTIIEALWG